MSGRGDRVGRDVRLSAAVAIARVVGTHDTKRMLFCGTTLTVLADQPLKYALKPSSRPMRTCGPYTLKHRSKMTLGTE